MISNEIKVRVRYGETDRMGYAHHSVYALYFEEGRTELLREFGMDYKSMEDNGYILPMASLSVEYIKPAKYDDLLTVKTILKEKPGVRLTFEYEVYGPDGGMVCRALGKMVFANKVTGRPCRPYPEFVKLVDKVFQV
ncbi:MAG: acyl-CoA thioesterase [Bacteroidota bacterium]